MKICLYVKANMGLTYFIKKKSMNKPKILFVATTI